jgi:hypothetical protein
MLLGAVVLAAGVHLHEHPEHTRGDANRVPRRRSSLDRLFDGERKHLGGLDRRRRCRQAGEAKPDGDAKVQILVGVGLER